MIVVPDLATLAADAVARAHRALHGRLRQRARPRADRRWTRATSCGARSSAARRTASSRCWRPRSSSTSPTRTGKPVYDGIQCYSLQKGAELEHVVGDIRRVDRGVRHRRRGLQHGVRPGPGRDQLRPRPAARGRRRHRRVQVGRARDRAQARPARDVHGEAVPRRLGQRAARPPQPARGRRQRVRARHATTGALGNASDAPLGRRPDDARRAARAAREPHRQRLQAHRGLLVRAHARELGARQPQRGGALHPAGRRGLARRVPRRRRRRQPLPARRRRAGRRHGRASSASWSCRRRPSTTPTPTSACRSCRARWAPRSTPGRRRRSRARRSASASPTTTRRSRATTCALYEAFITDWETQRYREFA